MNERHASTSVELPPPSSPRFFLRSDSSLMAPSHAPNPSGSGNLRPGSSTREIANTSSAPAEGILVNPGSEAVAWALVTAVRRYRGREISTTGDGFLATFDGPARAVRCAGAVAQGVRRL